jgi:hypothetical protein
MDGRLGVVSARALRRSSSIFLARPVRSRGADDAWRSPYEARGSGRTLRESRRTATTAAAGGLRRWGDQMMSASGGATTAPARPQVVVASGASSTGRSTGSGAGGGYGTGLRRQRGAMLPQARSIVLNKAARSSPTVTWSARERRASARPTRCGRVRGQKPGFRPVLGVDPFADALIKVDPAGLNLAPLSWVTTRNFRLVIRWPRSAVLGEQQSLTWASSRRRSAR